MNVGYKHLTSFGPKVGAMDNQKWPTAVGLFTTARLRRLKAGRNLYNARQIESAQYGGFEMDEKAIELLNAANIRIKKKI